MQVTLEQSSAWGPSWHLQGVTDGMVGVEEVMAEVVGVEVSVVQGVATIVGGTEKCYWCRELDHISS